MIFDTYDKMKERDEARQDSSMEIPIPGVYMICSKCGNTYLKGSECDCDNYDDIPNHVKFVSKTMWQMFDLGRGK